MNSTDPRVTRYDSVNFGKKGWQRGYLPFTAETTNEATLQRNVTRESIHSKQHEFSLDRLSEGEASGEILQILNFMTCFLFC